MICVSHVGGECVGCHLQESCSLGFAAMLTKIKSYSADTFKNKHSSFILPCFSFICPQVHTFISNVLHMNENNANNHRGTMIFAPHGKPCYTPQPPLLPTDLKLSRPISTLS